MRFSIVVLFVVFLSGCVQPQNVKEFMGAMGKGKESTVNKPVNAVVAKNTKLVKKCFNKTIKNYNPALRIHSKSVFTAKITKDKNAMLYSLQQDPEGYLNTNFPEGGMYIFSARVEPVSSSKTKITTNALWNHGNLEEAFHEWSNGKSSKCPDLM